MSDTTQLKALRDAAQAMHANANTKTVNRITAAVVSDLANDAIAALAAEGPKACEGFVCSYPPCPKGEPHSDIAPCRTCGQPFSAHQRPAPLAHGPEHGCAQAQQPARTAVPETPLLYPAKNYGREERVCNAGQIASFRRTAQAIAAERDAAEAKADRAIRALVRAGFEDHGGQDWKPPVNKEVGEAWQRTLQAERERDEARALAWEQAKKVVSTEFWEQVAWKAARDAGSAAHEARAELAALKAQEPQTPLQLAAAACRAVGMLNGDADAAAEAVRDLAMKLKNYAATHIPLAQHEAALAEARREERERCAVECNRLAEEARRTGDNFDAKGDPTRAYQWGHRQAQAHECGRIIRALRDGGEE